MIINIVWKEPKHKYGNSMDAYVGKYKLGGWHWDSLRSRRDPKTYLAKSYLPGQFPQLGNYETQEEAMEIVEYAIRNWFNNIEEGIDRE